VNRQCPSCGFEIFSIDDLDCPQCGTPIVHQTERRETAGQRRRRLRANWTEEDRFRDEDEAFALSLWILRREALIDRLEANTPADKWSRLLSGRRPRGRPPGPVKFTVADLEDAVDRLRREGVRLTQWRLAMECYIGTTTLTDFLAGHPEVWPALVARWRDRT